MNKKSKGIAAIVLAGGRGERCLAGTGLPKQFLILDGEPVYIWSLRAFSKHPQIDKFVLVVVPELLEVFKQNLEKYAPDLVNKIILVKGGARRQDSALAALECLTGEPCPPKFVLIHDAARPFISAQEINAIITSLEPGFGSVLAVPVTDSVKRVKKDLIAQTLDRNGLYLMQTPQAAELETLLTAHRKLHRSGDVATDDAALLEHAKVPVRIIPGSPRNFKITNLDEFSLAQAVACLIKNKAT